MCSICEITVQDMHKRWKELYSIGCTFTKIKHFECTHCGKLVFIGEENE